MMKSLRRHVNTMHDSRGSGDQSQVKKLFEYVHWGPSTHLRKFVRVMAVDGYEKKLTYR